MTKNCKHNINDVKVDIDNNISIITCVDCNFIRKIQRKTKAGFENLKANRGK